MLKANTTELHPKVRPTCDVYIVAGGSLVQLRWRIWEAQFMTVLEVGKIKLITSYTWHNFCH